MKYQVVREEYGKQTIVMQSDFEDKEQFKKIVESPQYKILRNGKDITDKYVK